MSRRNLLLALVGVAIAFGAMLPTLAAAQDNHFATNQFGSRSALMNGAVVAGVRDTSATFYNPGALALVRVPSVSVSANAYRIGKISIENGAGTGDDLSSQPLEQVPLLVSGMSTFEDLPGHTVGFAVLARQRFAFNTTARRDVIEDVLPFEPGDEDYIGSLAMRTGLDEIWVGGTYSYAFDETFGVGVSLFGALRMQDFTFNASGRAISQANAIAGASETITFDYLNVRLIAKIGFAADFGPLKLGFTVTLPSLNVYGSGVVSGDISVTNLDIDGDFATDDFVATDRQDDLFARYLSPFSIAAGAEYRIDDLLIAFAGEWIFGRGRYTVMQPKPSNFIRPSAAFGLNDVTEFLRITAGNDSTVNVAVALEAEFNACMRGIVSFGTDFAANLDDSDNVSGFELGVSDWNIFHVGAGLILTEFAADEANPGGVKVAREVSFGAVVSFASGNVFQVVNFSTPRADNFLLGDTEVTTANFLIVGVLLGYTHYF